MKQQLFKKFSLLLVSVLAVSCSMEEDYIQKQNSAQQTQDFKISLLTKSEIHKRTSLAERINRISGLNRSNGLNRVVYDSIYDFYIDTDQALLIENDSLTSYTFSVVRPEQEIQTENLVIQTKNDSTVVYLVDYQEDLNVVKNMTAEEAMTLNTLFYELNGTADRCSATIICKDIYTYEYGVPCNEGNNTGGQVYCDGWVYQGSSCTLVRCGGGDSGNEEDSGTTSFPNNTGGSNPDPDEEEIVTTPLPVLEENSGTTPCDELNKLTKAPSYPTNPYMDDNDVRIRTAIINMADGMSTNGEVGYGFYNQGNYPEYGPFANYTESTNGRHVNFPTRGYQFGTIHTHPSEGHLPMFSHDDIYNLYTIASHYALNTPEYNPAGNNLFVCVMVVKIGVYYYTYAIKIENFSKLATLSAIHPYFNGLGSGTKTTWKDYGEKLGRYYQNKANGINGTPMQYERALLQFIKDQDLGVSLYEMEQTGFGTPFVKENWKKLELGSDNNTINEIPCK
ncbi:hypothetical protein [Flavobacterium sp. U410]